jgi:hypothetical protein
LNTQHAAPTAHGYCCRFLRQLKIGYRDFILALSAAIIAPLIARFAFHQTEWEVALISAALAAIVVFVGDCVCKALALLWRSYKGLQDALLELSRLKCEIEARKRLRVETARDVGDFLWTNRHEETPGFWENSRLDWCEHTVNAVADFLDVDKERAKEKLYDWPASPPVPTGAERLEKHLNNLKVIIS